MFLTRAIELFWIALNFAGLYFSHNDVIINNYSRHIRMKTRQHQIDAYYKQRRQWDSQVLPKIHWKAPGQWLDSLKMLPPMKEKTIFRMPVTQRLKTGAYRLQLWIDIADHIYFDNKQQRPQGTGNLTSTDAQLAI